MQLFGKDTERCPDIILLSASIFAITATNRQDQTACVKASSTRSKEFRTEKERKKEPMLGKWDTTEPVKSQEATISHIEIGRHGQRTILDSSLPSVPEPDGGKDQAGC